LSGKLAFGLQKHDFMYIPGAYLTIPGLLKPEEIVFLERLLHTVTFEDGTATATDAAKSVKKNLQMPKTGSMEKQQIDGIFFHALSNSPLIQAAVMPTRILPPTISKYEPGMHYGAHVDSPIMGDPQMGVIRTDVGMTLFLSDPETYEGGELYIYTPTGEVKFKLNKGDAIIYPTTQVHGVTPVTAGMRLAAISWMQCAVRSSTNRELLFQLKSVQSMLEQSNAQSPENLILLQIYSNLLRMWAEI
jgi:PKHD-type hydroxylase